MKELDVRNSSPGERGLGQLVKDLRGLNDHSGAEPGHSVREYEPLRNCAKAACTLTPRHSAEYMGADIVRRVSSDSRSRRRRALLQSNFPMPNIYQ